LNNDEPTTYKEAMMGPDSGKWLEAMKSKIVSIYKIKFLNLADHPEG
jgi:hypothetical protein